MIDKRLVKRRLDEINEALQYIEEIIKENEEDFIKDYKSRFTLRHLILIVVESAASIAIHILSEAFNENVESYGEAFIKLAYYGVLSLNVAKEMASLARLRNLIVHRYWLVDDSRIYQEAKNTGISIIKKFVKELVNYLEGN